MRLFEAESFMVDLLKTSFLLCVGFDDLLT